jgi:hypothetical protein
LQSTAASRRKQTTESVVNSLIICFGVVRKIARYTDITTRNVTSGAVLPDDVNAGVAGNRCNNAQADGVIHGGVPDDEGARLDTSTDTAEQLSKGDTARLTSSWLTIYRMDYHQGNKAVR